MPHPDHLSSTTAWLSLSHEGSKPATQFWTIAIVRPFTEIGPISYPDPAFPDLGGKHWSEEMSKSPDVLAADVHAAFIQRILNVSPRQWET